ncbi:putative uncharacterized protein [Proteobacteria bacterium CAG:495]|jgi:Uncharacterized protein, involved in the regulation of septum location|nr:putative uncharacterized protein [Proteobacteria bacterium CAG:495]
MSAITEVNIDFIKPRDGLIGFASITFDNKLFLGCIGIHKKLTGGYRITYPTKSERHLYHPISNELGRDIENAIFEKLKDVMKKLNDDRYDSLNNARAEL